jgi:hypothetical protein
MVTWRNRTQAHCGERALHLIKANLREYPGSGAGSSDFPEG